MRWRDSPHRRELLALYAEVDALLAGWSCACSASEEGGAGRCCHFDVIGREPYPTAVELEEVRHGMRASSTRVRSPAPGLSARGRRRLPVAPESRTCPLLDGEGRCRIYASRPFGCRTFFCDEAEGPAGARPRLPAQVREIGRRIADLSARFAPRDPLPRPLTRALPALAARTQTRN
jgi:Fe-S-cluster containining protein